MWKTDGILFYVSYKNFIRWLLVDFVQKSTDSDMGEGGAGFERRFLF